MKTTSLSSNFVRRSLPTLTQLSLLTFFALLLIGAPASFAATMVWESNNFDTNAGNWNITYNNSANGNNVDWMNSNLAGGTAGELGGTFARHTSTAFYGRLLDFNVSLNDPLHWRGVFSCTNTFLNWNNSVYIGYFNTTAALADNVTSDYVAWRVREPNAGATTLLGYRTRAQINVNNVTLAQQSSPNAAYNQGTSYSFDVQWTPSGLNDGGGTYSGSIGSYSFSQAVGPQSNVGNFDAFGLFWDESAIDANVRFNGAFDSLEYLVSTVPEPSPAMLAGVGALAFALRGRIGRRK